VGRVSPHIFYQACKVSGKNSTPCNEVKIEGTMIIEIEIKPENDMTVVCDCVGILKERNVDVEHRLGKNNTLAASAVTRNKKKSTKCRMIFRTKINEDSDYPEILQMCSNTITCTQPPGVPEICKKSLDTCGMLGGKELFIIGKNFLKDTKVTFVRYDRDETNSLHKKIWEETVQPDKEYLQQTHLICTVPACPNAEEITEPIQVQIYVTSSNKKSEPHNFLYVPLKKYRSSPLSIDLNNIVFNGGSKNNTQDSNASPQIRSVLTSLNWSEGSPVSPADIMPATSSTNHSRKPSFSASPTNLNESKISLKTEFIDQTAVCSNDLQKSSTSIPSVSTIQASSASVNPSVKEIIYNESALLGQCFVNPNIGSSSQVLLSEFQANASQSSLDLHHHIKSEQNVEMQQQNNSAIIEASNVTTAMLPPPPPPSAQPEFGPVQQQQVVENFLLNMICAQVDGSNSNLNTNLQADHAAANLCAISTQSPMMCEQNLLQMTDGGTNIIPSIETSTESTNASLMSNAVSDATAETQAVVKQMIATVTAELLSENPVETQSTITNFISSTLVNDMVQAVSTEQAQQQISDSQQQQLQEIIAQELLTPVMIKKEENNG
jgi:hypothetical protein